MCQTSTIFIHFLHSLYFWYMFRCHIHRHQGELLCCLLKTWYCYEVCGYKKVKWSRYRPGVAQRVGRGIALLLHNGGTRRGWVVSSTLRPHFNPRKDPVPILQEAGWAPGLVWTGEKSRPHRDSIPDRPARSSVAIPTELLGPLMWIYVMNKHCAFSWYN